MLENLLYQHGNELVDALCSGGWVSAIFSTERMAALMQEKVRGNLFRVKNIALRIISAVLISFSDSEEPLGYLYFHFQQINCF